MKTALHRMRFSVFMHALSQAVDLSCRFHEPLSRRKYVVRRYDLFQREYFSVECKPLEVENEKFFFTLDI
jgi:hypothetical protein